MTGPRADRPPRVLCALNLDASQKFGSLEEQVLFLARACRDVGGLFVPAFVGPCGPTLEDACRSEGLAVEALDLRQFSWRRLTRLLGLIREHRADAVHWQFYPALGNGYVWALGLLAPWVRQYYTDHFSRHGPPTPPAVGTRRLAKRLLFDRYRKLVGVSRFVADCLREQGAGENLTHTLHFVNTDRFRPDAEVRRHVRTERGVGDRFVALAVGQLIAHKGVDVAVRALAELPADVVLWLVGDGEQRAELEQLCRELGVADRVHFLGMQQFVQPFMQAADVLVCPSRWREAAGLVNLEAQACGLPVVASAIGGIPEYVEDGCSGMLFPPEDHQRLAACLRSLRDNPALRQTMADEARRVAVERFSPSARLDEYLRVYQ